MAAPARRPPAPKAPARIGTCQADFDVAAAHGPLSSPENLLAAVRQEILPALSEVLDDPVWQGLRIDAPLVEIDLGTWPDEPVWSEVRHVLALKLRQALEAYRQSDRNREEPADAGPSARAADPHQPKTDTQPKDHLTDAASATLSDAASAPKSRDAQQAPPQRQHKDHLTDVTSSEPLDPAPAPKPKEAQQTSPRRQQNDRLAAPNPSERLTDPGPSAALRAFSDWLDAQEKGRDRAEILAHLATRPALQAALLLWESADAQARQAALPLTQTQRQEVQIAAERLATQFPPRREAGDAAFEEAPQPAGERENSKTGVSAQPVNKTASPPRPAQVLQSEQSERMARARLRQRLATETTPQADALRAAAHRLATLLHASGTGADHARDHSMILLTGLLSVPDFADTLEKQARLDTADLAVKSQSPAVSAANETADAAKMRQTDRNDALSQRRNPIVRDRQTDGNAQSDGTAIPVPSALESGLDAASSLDVPDTPKPSLHDLATLAATLDPDAAHQHKGASALRHYVQQQFSQRPAIVFDAAQAIDHLPTLAALLDVGEVSDVGDVGDVAKPVLFGRQALTAHQIKALYHANPNPLRRALQARPVTDLSRLATRLVPDSATLLRAQIADLQQQAAHPKQALQAAILAILATRPLDVEALRTLDPDEPARKTPPAPLGTAEGAQQNDQSRHPTAEQHAEKPARTSQIRPEHTVADTPLRALLSLSGLNDAEIDRVTAAQVLQTPASDPTPTQASELRSEARQDADSPTLHTPKRSDAALYAHLQKLAAATNPASGEIFADVLALIWSVWPHPPQTPPLAPDPTAENFALLRAQLTAQATPTDGSLAALLDAALPVLEPDLDRHSYALRTVLARLSSLTGPDTTGLRTSTRATVAHLLAPPPDDTPQPPTRPSAPVQTDTSAFADATSAEQTLQVTETAGLVLLHPFITLLFDRLKIDRDRKTLAQDHLPRALGALQFLAGEAAPNDPLHRVLLGLDAAVPLPEAETPDEDACTLMDGLLRSVIERWGRLGATSPDGLRETFIRRTGTLHFDENGARLRVTPGPFDMLLDSLPWGLSPVALPWMPLPCTVSWREDEDA